MSQLRNLPVEKAAPLAGLISVREHQVASKALTRGEGVQMTLLAFDEGEDISEEQYFGDTLYFMVEGSGSVCISGGEAPSKISLSAGEVLMVPARTLHAVKGDGAFKILQMTLKEEA